MSYGPVSQGSNSLVGDARSLSQLKLQASQASPAAIKETAKQFEALFMREMIKSMREATMKSGLLDSPQGDLGADLLDQQLAVQMSGRPGGLSDLIAKQLTRQMNGSGAVATPAPTTPAAITPDPTTPLSKANPLTPPVSSATPSLRQREFVQRHDAVAAKVAQASGIPSGFMLGQAGHETGWGKSEIKTADGSSSFNLFGIKAGSGWQGKVAEVVTTEYENGVAKKTVARFRAYDSYEASFKDYARLLTQSPRYAQVSQQTGSVQAFANGLQRAGYATDPAYASKLSRAINSTLQLQRAFA
jgi:flagellar protein FlgJ